MPFRLDHVNCWWLRNGEGSGVQIDTGIASDKTRGLWRSALGDDRIDALVVTHFHPDHAGLAGEYSRGGCTVYASETEMALSQRIWQLSSDDYAELYAGWYRRHGLGDEAVQGARALGNGYRRIVTEPAAHSALTWLAPGDNVTLGQHDWQVLHGRGHAPAMILLYAAASKLLIAADQVLPTISPNVSVGPSLPSQPTPFDLHVTNPLAQFLDTLAELRALPSDTLVLPSHGLPFRGLHERIDELALHHEERLARVLESCAERRTAADLFDVLFGKKLDAQQMSFALGESLAHAEYLVARGELQREDDAEIVHYRVRL